jgi:endonuclease YncB( thermonuclease family)
MPGFRYVWRRLAIVLGAMLAALLLHLLQPAPAPFGGSASAVDGDTIRLAGERVRLVGLDAPELAQSCTGADGRQWGCGTAARRLMRQLLARGEVTCTPQGYDRYDRVLARCSAGGADLGAAVVGAGLAVADGGYLAEQAAAQGRKAGIWAGSFTPPAQWRREQQGETEPNLFDVVRGWLR